MTTRTTAEANSATSWKRRAAPIIVGKDILDLISTSMYVDPMTVYREYVQNAADAIDEVRALGNGFESDFGRVDISIDASNRRICIRDNGGGVKSNLFEDRLTSFGASAKRGTKSRGFRGVGRLSGLGYCQELIFRSRAHCETKINEMRWDCRSIKASLRSSGSGATLEDVVNNAVERRAISGDEWPEHFFEVEMRGVVRHKNDALLNPQAVSSYLSQIAPVPFSPSFRFGEEINSALANVDRMCDLEIKVSGIRERVYRPHRNTIEINGVVFDAFGEVEVITIPALDGGDGAVGWILHHSYKGAIPSPELRGLRVRTGNIQVGGNDLFQENFPEPRFNSWTVGEIHTIDRRIVPNGRRDHYEQDLHFHNLTNHLTPVARAITTRCRRSSVVRHLLRDFERSETLARQKLQAVRQGGIGFAERKQIIIQTQEIISKMARVMTHDGLEKATRSRLKSTVSSLERALSRTKRHERPSNALAKLSPAKRRAYQDILELIYQCSSSHNNAHLLVERILAKLG
jgi:molecular chaperone HtpG